MPRTSLRRSLTAPFVLLLTTHASAEMDFRARGLERLAPGVLDPESPPQGYSHVVMIAWPRIPVEQARSISATTAKFAQMFGSAILADVRRDPQTGLHRLNRVAIGHTMRSEGGVQIVSPKSEGLTFLASQVLASGEKELDKIRQIARYDTAVLFESPAVILRGGAHQELKVRHFVWTSAKLGGLASVVWLVDEAPPSGPTLVDNQVVQLPSRFTDDRVLSVDPAQFSFVGTPGKTAFAMTRLPRGRAIAVGPELARLAAAPAYDNQTLPALARGLAQAVASQP
ncbi:hypothetical protein KOR34_27260 [Posidoniimonas corsicana]|uniref:Uncharacterized protein n=1 Tax=Posidoniimonas corsicana TaxID=1938618 RepID=A0A5C5VIB3_9BACT|nr:hypothetical protein [Posidoniimonas corsicana]TWT37763.1 hypothetical protein KOR34_27260 [Posidoniimonas corsicana]